MELVLESRPELEMHQKSERPLGLELEKTQYKVRHLLPEGKPVELNWQELVLDEGSRPELDKHKKKEKHLGLGVKERRKGGTCCVMVSHHSWIERSRLKIFFRSWSRHIR